EDVGEKCDDDELGPIRTGRPDIEPPSRKDPIYDITQALHDPTGAVIGAAGMDLRPEPGASRETTLQHARFLLRELESRISSKADLLARLPGTSGGRRMAPRRREAPRWPRRFSSRVARPASDG